MANVFPSSHALYKSKMTSVTVKRQTRYSFRKKLCLWVGHSNLTQHTQSCARETLGGSEHCNTAEKFPKYCNIAKKICILQIWRIQQYRNSRLKLPKYRKKNYPIPQTPMSPPVLLEESQGAQRLLSKKSGVPSS